MAGISYIPPKDVCVPGGGGGECVCVHVCTFVCVCVGVRLCVYV